MNKPVSYYDAANVYLLALDLNVFSVTYYSNCGLIQYWPLMLLPSFCAKGRGALGVVCGRRLAGSGTDLPIDLWGGETHEFQLWESIEYAEWSACLSSRKMSGPPKATLNRLNFEQKDCIELF